MVNLLNGVTFFGIDTDLSSQATTVWLIVIQVILAVAIISIIIYFLLRIQFKLDASQDAVSTQAELIAVQEEDPAIPERVLMGISLDLTVVNREFKAGDEFDCAGLLVLCEYNLAPTMETLVDYSVIDDDRYARLKKRGKTQDVYVIKPYMYTAGTKVVSVSFQGYTAEYSITVEQILQPTVEVVEQPVVVETPVVEVPLMEEESAVLEQNTDFSEEKVEKTEVISQEQPVVVPEEPSPPQKSATVIQRDLRIVEEEAYEAILRYDRSFTARLIQSEDEVKHWYTDIKNVLLSYKGVKARTSWKRETFKCGGKLVLAKLAYRGKVLCLFLPLKHGEFTKDYHVEDASDKSCYEDTPMMLRLKNAKRLEMAKELIKLVMEHNAMKLDENYEAVDYYMPYEGILNLINKDLIKRNIRTTEEEAIFSRDTDVQEDEDLLTLTKVGPGIYVTKKD